MPIIYNHLLVISHEICSEFNGLEGLVAVGVAGYSEKQNIESPTIHVVPLSTETCHQRLLEEALFMRGWRALAYFSGPDYAIVAESVPALCLSIESSGKRLGSIAIVTAVRGEAKLSHEEMARHIAARLNHFLLEHESSAVVARVRGRLLEDAVNIDIDDI